MEIVLARHGETEWSRDLKHTGRTDLPLTDHGRAEAERLRPGFEGRSFVRVLSSPLERALDTCRLAGLGDEVELTDDLLEWDYGEYEGITTAEIREGRPDFYLWRDGCPGGESAADVGARVDRVVTELRSLDGRRGAVLTRPRAAGAHRALAGPRSRVGRPLQARYGHAVGVGLRAQDAGDHAVELTGVFRLGATAPIRATSGTKTPTMPAILRPRLKQTTASATPAS